ncbi:hypothetical protein EV363DRAFT_322023 [Boletus edulis]|nr:hypothetical protein EV363DRAFT_322023 [Boletus edulis]
MAELEDEDDFPNDFDGLNFDNIPGLQAPSIGRDNTEVFVPSSVIPQNSTPSTAASPVPSTGSNSTEDMDPIFLAAVDALEARALNEMPRGTESTQGVINTLYQAGGTSNLNQVGEQSTESSSVDRKGKRKAEEDIDVRAILAGYETELTCPICCDLLVGAQVANPCGHTCCGECGYGWLAQNKYEPTCAICRSNLPARNPLLPNFAVDSIVRQHLQALSRSGRPEWQERGYRTIEWNKRVDSWKGQNDARTAKEKLKEIARPRRRQPRYYDPWGCRLYTSMVN